MQGVGSMHMSTVYLGSKLGLFPTLVEQGRSPSAEP